MNRVILITGAMGSLGLSISKIFLENNDIVYLNYHLNKDKAKEITDKYQNAKLIK